MTPAAKLIASLESIKSSPWAFFVNNWRVTILALIMIVVGGIIGLLSLPQESDPEVNIPIGVVSVPYPGASPADIEKLITDKLEDRLKNLDDLEKLSSTSSEGVAVVVVEFDARADMIETMRELRDEIDIVKSDFPEDALDPIISEVRADDFPIITFSLLANLPPAELKSLGENLQDEIESIRGVSEVIMSGVRDEEMQVLIDIRALEGYGLSLGQVVSAISSSHIDMPIGSILTNGFYYQTSVKAQINTADDLLAIPVATLGGQNIYLRDIAEVREVFGEVTSSAQVFDRSSADYKKSITLQVFKKTGASIIDITDSSKQQVDVWKTENLPPSAGVLVTNDNSKFIRQDISTLGRNGVQTVIIIFLLLLVALGRREAMLVGMSLPMIFLLSFLVLFLVGETLNGLVLFALILSLGLIVDTSIVIMEGIHDGVQKQNLSPRDAALYAIRIYKAPLIAGTLTTIAAFTPMAMMSGIMGEYVKHIPITVGITLLASLFIAIMIVPSVASHLFTKEEKKHVPLMSRYMQPLRDWYLLKIREILHSQKLRRHWTVGMIISFFIALSLPITGILPVQMFPVMNIDYFVVNVELPIGSQLSDTKKITERVERILEDTPELENFVTIMGGGAIGMTKEANFGAGGRTSSSHKATITVNLTEKNDRNLTSQEISDHVRGQLRVITDAKVEVEELQSGPPTGAPIEVRIIGDDIASLESFARIIESRLKEIEGAKEISTDIEHGPGEFHFRLKKDRLKYYGISARALATDLRTAVYGNDSVKIIRDGEETPIVIRLDWREDSCRDDKINNLLERRDRMTICPLSPQSISQIQNLLIPSERGQVPLRELADIELASAVTSIRHLDSDTIVSVRAYNETDITPGQIVESLKEKMSEISVPSGIHIEYGGETEDTTDSFASLGRAMGVGIGLIILILVFQFNSFRQPFIIMFTIPLSLIGVFVGLALLGKNFSFPGFIGIVALSGIVVNDAIVLIDRINHNIRDGLDRVEAIIEAGGARLQPIILTTITTSAGVLPLAFASEIWGDLAWTIAIGIIFATVLTLVMVPIFYYALEKNRKLQDINER